MCGRALALWKTADWPCIVDVVRALGVVRAEMLARELSEVMRVLEYTAGAGRSVYPLRKS